MIKKPAYIEIEIKTGISVDKLEWNKMIDTL
jgi:hypothetical protein